MSPSNLSNLKEQTETDCIRQTHVKASKASLDLTSMCYSFFGLPSLKVGIIKVLAPKNQLRRVGMSLSSSSVVVVVAPSSSQRVAIVH